MLITEYGTQKVDAFKYLGKIIRVNELHMRANKNEICTATN